MSFELAQTEAVVPVLGSCFPAVNPCQGKRQLGLINHSINNIRLAYRKAALTKESGIFNNPSLGYVFKTSSTVICVLSG